MRYANIYAIALLAALAGACSDEEVDGFRHRDGHVSLAIGENRSWTEGAITRSEIDAPMRLDCDLEGAQPLYLHTEITPTQAEALAYDGPVTRGDRHTGPVFDNGSVTSFGVCLKAGSTYYQEHFTIASDMTKDNTSQGAVGTGGNSYWYYKEYSDGVMGDHWGGASTADFYGYAPNFTTSSDYGLSITANESFNGGIPTIEYSAPTTVANQIDLLTAKHLGVTRSQDVELVFDHVLSAIKFKVDNTTTIPASVATTPSHGGLQWTDGLKVYNVAIKSVAIKGVYYHGWWKIGDQVYATSGNDNDDPANNWTRVTPGTSTEDTGTRDFTISFDEPRTNLSGTAPVEVNGDASGKVFMMLPQETPAGATLEIVCTMTPTTTGSAKDVRFTLPFNGKTWKPGYTYNYTLKLSDVAYVFSIHDNETDKNNGTFTSTASGTTYSDVKIRSYKKDANNNAREVSWRAEYSMDGGTTYNSGLPDWIQINKDATNGTTNVGTAIHAGALQDHVNKEFDLIVDKFYAERIIDLSLYSPDTETPITRSTANSYIVSLPGTYRIPLVYGNAILNGEENTEAWKISKTEAGFLSTFKNWNGGDIYSSFINDDVTHSSGTISTTAEIVWQDVNGLISNTARVVHDNDGNTDISTYDGNTKGYLEFTIELEHMNYGNAVIAIKDGNNQIIWSWHIWVTNPSHFLDSDNYGYTHSRTILGFDKQTYTFAGENLGWVDTQEVTLLPSSREVFIKLTQEETNDVINFKVHQNNGTTFNAATTHTFYQWGRKDAFPGNNGSNQNITTYKGDGTPGGFSYTKVSTGQTLGTCIRNPGVQYVTSGSAYLQGSTGMRNLWNMNSDNEDPENGFAGKTIYDPCPVGYRIPPSRAWQCLRFGVAHGDGYVVPETINGLIYGVRRSGYSSNTNLKLPILGYRDGDHGSNPVEWNKCTYYQQAGHRISTTQNNQVRIRYYDVASYCNGDDCHRGDENRAMPVRAVKDPDCDLEMLENNPFTLREGGIAPERSLSRGSNNF